ncbi:hypothetical protein HPB51_004165 [Rhipicephalus microplus]|uniref:Tick transposon n=1 Tax=Rhipicephalus microplus TaxID=6941 RepID=A0A9J6D4J8_RHIMP|nr:hypothetical protein HPB51_004165 [Rhipicephalus microplus]
MLNQYSGDGRGSHPSLPTHRNRRRDVGASRRQKTTVDEPIQHRTRHEGNAAHRLQVSTSMQTNIQVKVAEMSNKPHEAESSESQTPSHASARPLGQQQQTPPATTPQSARDRLRTFSEIPKRLANCFSKGFLPKSILRMLVSNFQEDHGITWCPAHEAEGGNERADRIA